MVVRPVEPDLSEQGIQAFLSIPLEGQRVVPLTHVGVAWHPLLVPLLPKTAESRQRSDPQVLEGHLEVALHFSQGEGLPGKLRLLDHGAQLLGGPC